MTEIDEILKEFHAQYGFAMHNVQILERGLLELYGIKRFVDDNLSEIEYYKIVSNPRKWTIGIINRELFALNFLEDELKEKLLRANKIRTFLAHRFWWEREIEFNNPNKLIKLRQEISSYCGFIMEIMIIIDSKIVQIRSEIHLNIEDEMGLTNFTDRENFIQNLSFKSKQTN